MPSPLYEIACITPMLVVFTGLMDGYDTDMTGT